MVKICFMSYIIIIWGQMDPLKKITFTRPFFLLQGFLKSSKTLICMTSLTWLGHFLSLLVWPAPEQVHPVSRNNPRGMRLSRLRYDCVFTPRKDGGELSVCTIPLACCHSKGYTPTTLYLNIQRFIGCFPTSVWRLVERVQSSHELLLMMLGCHS